MRNSPFPLIPVKRNFYRIYYYEISLYWLTLGWLNHRLTLAWTHGRTEHNRAQHIMHFKKLFSAFKDGITTHCVNKWLNRLGNNSFLILLIFLFWFSTTSVDLFSCLVGSNIFVNKSLQKQVSGYAYCGSYLFLPLNKFALWRLFMMIERFIWDILLFYVLFIWPIN